MLKDWFLTHIAQYLKITPKVLSGARNGLETPNLDQRYLVGVSRRVQRDFWKFSFFTHFLGAAGEKIANKLLSKLLFSACSALKNGQKIKIFKNPSVPSEILLQGIYGLNLGFLGHS